MRYFMASEIWSLLAPLTLARPHDLFKNQMVASGLAAIAAASFRRRRLLTRRARYLMAPLSLLGKNPKLAAAPVR